MANPEHVAVVKQGTAALSDWRKVNSDVILDLTDAELSGAILNNANLHNSNLSSANLSGARLSVTKLRATNLSNANLSGANLSSASLRSAKLIHASLSGANLSHACFGYTVFGFNDLSSVTGLEWTTAVGPSLLDIHTLKASNGRIADKFLRNCGLSPWEVEMAKLYNPDLTANEISNLMTENVFQLRTYGPLHIGGVFISYSHTDKGIADKLYTQFQDAGVSVWQDRHDMVAGDINKQVQRELRLRDIVVLILSESSVTSDWVEHELKTTRQKEKAENRDVLCPITLDDGWKSKMNNPNWGHLSDKLVLDFSKWKTKSFAIQFAKLLKGMKINYEVKKD